MSQGTHQIRFAASGRPHHQHIGFLNLHAILAVTGHTFIVVVYGHRHHLLGILLPHHILIQAGLDLMRCRDGLDIQLGRRFFLFLGLFLLQLLPPGQRIHILQIGQVNHADIRHIAKAAHIPHWEPDMVHTVKGLLHTVGTDADLAGNLNHCPGLALRTVADIADILIFTLLRGIAAPLRPRCGVLRGILAFSFPQS